MSESGDFDPGHWRGHDFNDARVAYDRHAGRGYSQPPDPVKKPSSDLVPRSMSTDSPSPLVIITDVTDSMDGWTETMFSKMPYLELEGQEYLGKAMEISFGGVGDAFSDHYPLQARPFTKGVALKDRLKELNIERGGGGTRQESYELSALYYARKVTMPKAIRRPILIMIGDEAPYDVVDSAHAKTHAYETLKGRLSTAEIFRELQAKYSVYLIRKPYGRITGNSVSPYDQEIHQKWSKLLSDEFISDLPQADRVVDVIFGILAKETGRIEYFREELEGRQRKDQVETVYKSLASIHRMVAKGPKDPPDRSGKSLLHGGHAGEESKPLM